MFVGIFTSMQLELAWHFCCVWMLDAHPVAEQMQGLSVKQIWLTVTPHAGAQEGSSSAKEQASSKKYAALASLTSSAVSTEEGVATQLTETATTASVDSNGIGSPELSPLPTPAMPAPAQQEANRFPGTVDTSNKPEVSAVAATSNEPDFSPLAEHLVTDPLAVHLVTDPLAAEPITALPASAAIALPAPAEAPSSAETQIIRTHSHSAGEIQEAEAGGSARPADAHAALPSSTSGLQPSKRELSQQDHTIAGMSQHNLVSLEGLKQLHFHIEDLQTTTQHHLMLQQLLMPQVKAFGNDLAPFLELQSIMQAYALWLPKFQRQLEEHVAQSILEDDASKNENGTDMEFNQIL